jgi:hypothetical protein
MMMIVSVHDTPQSKARQDYAHNANATQRNNNFAARNYTLSK